jgi:hypothetical protein
MLPAGPSDALDDDDDGGDAGAQDHGAADAAGARLLVSGLAPSVDAARLRTAFEPFGAVVAARVARPGLGHVVFAAPAAADVALEKMQAPPPPPRPAAAPRRRRPSPPPPLAAAAPRRRRPSPPPPRAAATLRR